MKSYSIEKKIDQATESVRICRFNIENQENKLKELNKKIAIIQSKMGNTNLLDSNEHQELININSKLMVYIGVQKGLILELQGELDINQDRLQQLKSNSL